MAQILSHGDYSVALICALDTELAAARVMLDKIHDPLPQSSTDYNAYTLGEMSGHNVVIACLPSGVYGTVSAATVMTNTLRTFKSLRFALMVGIGGGVPNKHSDIRLGDVVVGIPNGTSSGVIQHDYGKFIEDGKFQPTGYLNKPPQALLTAVSQVRGSGIIGEPRVGGIVSEKLQGYPEMRERCSRPKNDWLFNSEYEHQTSNGGCSACDQSRLINRDPRLPPEPYIHYGSIASGNQVIKDAQRRDSIAREFGILCFEMEAAGLVDQLPCLVIRGVCDYCDSHKQKQWQGYAALTAAAYAKVILSAVPPSNPVETRRLECGIPLSTPKFVGRNDILSKLRGIVTGPSPGVVVLQGMGGVGKTQIALQICRRAPKDYSAVLWASAETRSSLEASFASFARKLGHVARATQSTLSETPENSSVEFVKEKLNNKRFLLVIDNLDNLDEIGDIEAIEDLFPSGDKSCILITRYGY
jgi:nucleoside phosphorylase